MMQSDFYGDWSRDGVVIRRERMRTNGCNAAIIREDNRILCMECWEPTVWHHTVWNPFTRGHAHWYYLEPPEEDKWVEVIEMLRIMDV